MDMGAVHVYDSLFRLSTSSEKFAKLYMSGCDGLIINLSKFEGKSQPLNGPRAYVLFQICDPRLIIERI
jgi:hypothetical protein